MAEVDEESACDAVAFFAITPRSSSFLSMRPSIRSSGGSWAAVTNSDDLPTEPLASRALLHRRRQHGPVLDGINLDFSVTATGSDEYSGSWAILAAAMPLLLVLQPAAGDELVTRFAEIAAVNPRTPGREPFTNLDPRPPLRLSAYDHRENMLVPMG